MTPLMLYGVVAVVTFILLLVGTKLHDGSVTVGDFLGCLVVSAIPFANFVITFFLWCCVAIRHVNFFSKKLF